MNSNSVFPYLRLSLGNARPEDFVFPDEHQLEELLTVAKPQGLSAILFAGLDKVDTSGLPSDPKRTQSYRSLIGAAMFSEELSSKHAERAGRLIGRLAADGHRSCVLKGVGLAGLYPERYMRHPGDLDLWMDGSRKETLSYVSSHWTVGEVVYHHCEVKGLSHPDVEFHFTPSWMFDPWDNRRLQSFFRRNAEAQFSNVDPYLGFPVPTMEFNLVYVMVHIYRHLFDEGLKIKQLLDYYYILANSSESQRLEAFRTLKSLHVDRFAAGVMHILTEKLGLPKELALCPGDKRVGDVIISELDDYLFDRGVKRPGESFFRRVYRRGAHRRKLFGVFPREVFWSTPFKTVQYLWRCKNGYFAS